MLAFTLLFVVAPFDPLSEQLQQQFVPVHDLDGVRGSGEVIAPGIVLTALHVVKRKTQYFVACGEDLISASVQSNDAVEDDLAVLLLERPCARPAVKAARKNPADNVRVTAIGCPNGRCGVITRGRVLGYLRYRNTHAHLAMTTVPLAHGNSGGPLVDSRGDLIGIATEIECEKVGQVATGGCWRTGVCEVTFSAEDEDTQVCQSHFVPIESIRHWLDVSDYGGLFEQVAANSLQAARVELAASRATE